MHSKYLVFVLLKTIGSPFDEFFPATYYKLEKQLKEDGDENLAGLDSEESETKSQEFPQ